MHLEMVFLRFFCGYFSLILLTSRYLLVRAEQFDQVILSNHTEAANIAAAPLPFYAVAHRVLTVQGVKDAIRHGANALELDMGPWKEPDGGWWGDHDHERVDHRGERAYELFKAIKEERMAGKTITFVWLDLKDPNDCDLDDPALRYCSIVALQYLAREFLQPVGVRVIYEFNGKNTPSKAYRFIVDSLNYNEAVTSYGSVQYILDKFDKNGPYAKNQRVMSYGWMDISDGFGDCKNDRGRCAEMRRGVASGKFGKVMAWTLAKGQAYYVDKLLGEANIDGLLYGSSSRNYDDGEDIRDAFNDISFWVSNHPDRRFLASQDDYPW